MFSKEKLSKRCPPPGNWNGYVYGKCARFLWQETRISPSRTVPDLMVPLCFEEM